MAARARVLHAPKRTGRARSFRTHGFDRRFRDEALSQVSGCPKLG